MRTLVLVVIGLSFLLGALPCQTIHAQNDGEIARLSSAAYAPDSPVTENKLFQYQTGHNGFAYNCDGEESKRNNPAICWQKADQCQLPKRIGCLERIRHEAAQVSRRILDGMCDSGCERCQQQSSRCVKSTCSCGGCLAKQNLTPDSATHSQPSLAIEQAPTNQTIAVVTPDPISATSRRPEESTVEEIELYTDEVLIGDVDVVPAAEEPTRSPTESAEPPVARITSAIVGSGLESVVEAPNEKVASLVAEVTPPTPKSISNDYRGTNLLERLKNARAAQSTGSSKAKKF